jgi:hypothetical protein
VPFGWPVPAQPEWVPSGLGAVPSDVVPLNRLKHDAIEFDQAFCGM